MLRDAYALENYPGRAGKLTPKYLNAMVVDKKKEECEICSIRVIFPTTMIISRLFCLQISTLSPEFSFYTAIQIFGPKIGKCMVLVRKFLQTLKCKIFG